MEETSGNVHGNHAIRRVVWCGPFGDEFGWLKSRIAGHRSTWVAEVDLIIVEQLDQLDDDVSSSGVDRLIVACQNRWDYSPQELRRWTADFPEIPVALAVGDWWLGWRRTGFGHLQNLPHLSLPWYRWWDGWSQWLDGSVPTMFGPFPVERVVVDKLPDSAIPHQSSASVLWDDSRLDTWFGSDQSIQLALEELVAIQARHPAVTLWVAWTLPTWEVVSRLLQAGLKFELLAKPQLLSLAAVTSLSSAALART